MKRFILILILLFIAIPFLFLQNNKLETTEYEIITDKISEDIKILQLSDLHNKEFGNNQSKIINKINEINPDVIVMTGDMIDGRRTKTEEDLEPVTTLIKELNNKYPIYYISGNHERDSDLWKVLIPKLEDLNVKFLSNEKDEVTSEITISGIEDSSYFERQTTFYKKLNNMSNNLKEDKFNILLSHRPTYMEKYKNTKFDLILSGHEHGGQWRFPFFAKDGLYSPSEAFFPKYTSGKINLGENNLIISRGLGNSRMPIRVLNYPEMVIINIKSSRNQ